MILSAVLEVEKIQGVSGKYAALICMGILCTSPVSEIDLSSLEIDFVLLSCSSSSSKCSDQFL
jgi:hypothetical protein